MKMAGFRLVFAAAIAAGVVTSAAGVSVVKVSDFGFDAEDSTRFLQAALDSGAKKVIVDRRSSPWITKPLFCRSGQAVFFEEGVEVVAKRGEFRAKDDCLFMLNGLHDVKLVGGGKGATLRMWREDYLKPPYPKAEWRHCVAIHGCCRVTVENLALRDSGGDGLYVGRLRRSGKGVERRVSRDIVARGLVSDGNARQGSSITAVENLLYENCTFSNTRGRPPQDGIDIEPNGKFDPIENCVFRNCRFENNASSGFAIACFSHDEQSRPITVTLEDCMFTGNKCSFAYAQNKRITKKRGWNRAHGRVVLRRCTFDRAREHAVTVRKPGDYLKFEMENCTIRDCCQSNPRLPDVAFDHLYGDIPPVDAVSIRNLQIFQPVERCWVSFDDVGYGAPKTENFVGDVTVNSPAGAKRIVLDAAFREWAFPAFWAKGEPGRRRPDACATVVDRAPGRCVALSRLRVRGNVRYVFHAAKAGKVLFRGRLAKIGKKAVEDATLEMRPLNGGAAVKVRVPVGKAAKDITVDVPAAGFYSLGADLGGHAFVLEGSEVPVGLDVSESPVAIQASAGDVWFSVYGGEPFNVMVSGQGWGERVGAELFDPSGISVWREPTALWWRGWRGRGSVASGMWRLRLTRPKEGRLEDFRVDMTGATGVLFLSSDKHW